MLALVATFASLAGFLFGYDLGLIGGALLNIRDAFGIGDWAAEAIVGAAKFGAVPGTFLGGALMLHYGRRRAIAADSLFFVLGPLVMALALGVGMLVAGRVVVGLGIGISAAVVPAYLGEVAPARVRGRVVECYELLLCAGMLAAALGDAAFQGLPSNWRWMVGAPIVPALLLSLALCLLPESPRWLVIRGRLPEALAVIHGMQQSTAEAEHELLQLWSGVEKERDAMLAQRAQHAERRRRRQQARQTKLAPLASSPLGAGGGASEAGKGGWQRLRGEEAAASAEAAALEAGAAGVRQRMELAMRALDEEPETPPAAASSEQHGLLPGGVPSSSSAAGPAPQSPLRVPTHLQPIRTSSAANLQQLAEVELQTPPVSLGGGGGAAAAAAAAAGSAAGLPGLARSISRAGSAAGALEPAAGLLGSSEWGAATRGGSQQLERLPSRASAGRPPPLDEVGEGEGEGGGGASAGDDDDGDDGGGSGGALQPQGPPREPSFWRTLRDMCLDIRLVAAGPEGSALRMALGLAFWNQACASTSIINYAPQVLERAGVSSHAAASLLASAVGASKLAGVALSFCLVDSLGRRPLLVWGSAGCALALAALAAADWLAIRACLVAAMCAFIFAFSASWAGVFWVLLSELFSMSAKSPATAAATAVLFLTGAVADSVFLSLHSWLGPLAFLLFAAVVAAAGIWVYAVVPETAGRTLQEIQALLALRAARGSRGGAQQEQQGLLPPGAALSDGLPLSAR